MLLAGQVSVNCLQIKVTSRCAKETVTHSVVAVPVEVGAVVEVRAEVGADGAELTLQLLQLGQQLRLVQLRLHVVVLCRMNQEEHLNTHTHAHTHLVAARKTERAVLVRVFQPSLAQDHILEA